MTDFSEISALDAHDQAALVRSGAVPPGALVEAAIAAIEATDPALNAVSHRAFELARAATPDRAAPMAGVPYLLKASLSYPGFPRESGSRSMRGVVGTRRYPLAERFDAAGLVPVGMSTMPEFGLMITGEALLTGPTRNPWNPAYSPGGSSSGAAVAVASGMVPLAQGSDAAGSIRVPAAHCGIIGFKPTRGWNVRARAANPFDDALTVDGLYGRSMRDTIWAAHHLRPGQGPGSLAPLDRPLRIAFDLAGLDGTAPDPAVAAALTRVAESCVALGHEVEPVTLPIDRAAISDGFRTLWLYMGGDVVDLVSAANPGAALAPLLEGWTLGLAARREAVAPEEVAAAWGCFAGVHVGFDGFWSRYDAVLSPVTAGPPPVLGTLAPDREFDALWRDHMRALNYTQLQNIGGFPAISLPLETSDEGLPIGAMFWAARGGDDLLLRLGLSIEQALPWAGRWPPVSAIRALAGADA